MQTAPTEAQSQLQVLDYYLRSHSDRIFRSLSPSHYCLKTRMSFWVLLQICMPLLAHWTRCSPHYPGAVDPLVAPLRRGRSVPGPGARTARHGTARHSTARFGPPGPPPAPTRSVGPRPHPPLPAETGGASGSSGSEEKTGRGAPPRLPYLTPPGVPASMTELPERPPRREGVATRRTSRETPRAPSATGPATDTRRRWQPGLSRERLRPAPLSPAHDGPVPPRGAEEARPARRSLVRRDGGGGAALRGTAAARSRHAAAAGGAAAGGHGGRRAALQMAAAGAPGECGERGRARSRRAGRCGDGRSERVRAGGRGCSARPPRAGLRSGASLPGRAAVEPDPELVRGLGAAAASCLAAGTEPSLAGRRRQQGREGLCGK